MQMYSLLSHITLLSSGTNFRLSIRSSGSCAGGVQSSLLLLLLYSFYFFTSSLFASGDLHIVLPYSKTIHMYIYIHVYVCIYIHTYSPPICTFFFT